MNEREIKALIELTDDLCKDRAIWVTRALHAERLKRMWRGLAIWGAITIVGMVAVQVTQS